MTAAQLDALARVNICLRGTADRTQPQTLDAEKVQQFYTKKLGAPVTLDDTFRILARHNARTDTVPVLTRTVVVSGPRRR